MLSPTTAWMQAAAAAAGEPRLLVELKPTVLYAEVTRDDWADYESASGVDTDHPSGELRLATEDVVAVRQSTAKQLTDAAGNRFVFHYSKDAEAGAESSARDRYDEIGQFIQTLTAAKGFRLSKLRIGARAMDWIGQDGYNYNLIVRLISDLRTSDALSVRGLYKRAAGEIWRGEANYGEHTVGPSTVTDKGTYLEFDLSEEYVYVPGGNRLHALDLRLDSWKNADKVSLFGASPGTYSGGQLYWHDHYHGISQGQSADLFFELVAEGFSSSGTAVYELDLGAAPGAGLNGELELKYVTPGSSAVSFRFRENNGAGWTSWAACDDGTSLNGYRYVQVEATLTADSDRLVTPRVLSIRAAYKRSDKFMLASGPLEGAPHLVNNAPAWSLEGDPLDGAASMSDTSEVTLLDPDGMLRENLIGGFNLKNDEAVFYLGWSGLDSGDYLQFKTLYIENAAPNYDGTVTLYLFDMFARFKNVEIPSAYDGDPALAEQIHFDGTLPGTIKTELLQRAGIRPSKINATSMAALSAGLDWSLVHGVKKQTKAQEICQDLNRHLLSFEYLDENGKWQSPYVDFSATPVATIQQEDTRDEPSESFDPGWERMKNVAAVYYDGEGDNEADYGAVALLTDATSIKAFKETASDRLLSEWVPQDDDAGDTVSGIASAIALRRQALQAQGVRSINFTTGMDKAALQLGDHIYYYASQYFRPGESSTNPLTCFITRKNVSPELRHIEWGALVLLDAGQSAPGLSAVGAPSGLTVTDNQNRTVDLGWTASSQDNGTTIKRYEVYARRKGLKDWGPFRTYKAADGSASYSITGLSIADPGYYDFGVLAVHKNRRVSSMSTALNQAVTDATLAAPSWLLVPVAGGWRFEITTRVTGALYYRIYKYVSPAAGWVAQPQTVPNAKKIKQSSEPLIAASLTDGYGTAYGRFKLASVNAAGVGTLSDEQADWSLPYQGTLLASSLAPTLPDESGAYPSVEQIQNTSGEYKYAVTLKITAPSGYADMVGRYEIERRDNGSGGYGSWELAGTIEIKNYPAQKTMYWTNHDARLKPGVSYQWRCRAIAKDGTASGYSASLTETVAYPTTPLDKPVVTVSVLAALQLLGTVSAPLRGGQAIGTGENIFYKIEVNTGAGWSTWVARHQGLVFIYPPVAANIAASIQFRVTAYDQHQNASTVSDATSAQSVNLVTNAVIAANTILAGNVAFSYGDVDSATIVAQINASPEGIDIYASLLAISANTTFSAGYDPTSKVAALAGQYNSASSGARVRIFPDSNTGILVTDGTNDVFKCLVGGTDVGDVIIGSTSSEYIQWDKSAATLRVKGLLDTALGESISDQNRVRVGKISGEAQVHLQSGGVDTAYFKAISIGTGNASSELWMTGYIGGGNHVEVTLRPGSLVFEYDSFETLRFDNDSKVTSGPELSTIAKITCSGGINITGIVGLLINGTAVLTGQMTYQSTAEGIRDQLIAVGLMASS